MPLVSIITPLYNQGEFLSDCINSILNQTFKDWECIIVDDCSTDGSDKIADLIAKRDSRIKVIHKTVNEGLSAARNTGISVCSGEYILPLDSDDMIAPMMLEWCLHTLKQGAGQIIYTDSLWFGQQNGLINMAEYSYELLQQRNHLFCCSLYPKQMWVDVGGYDERLRGLEDWQFWLKAGHKGYFGYHLPLPLFYYRTKAESMNKTVEKDEDRYKKIMFDTFEEFKNGI